MKFERILTFVLGFFIISKATSTTNHLRNHNSLSSQQNLDTKIFPGRAIDIGVGTDGTLWIAGSDNKISRWNEQLQKWDYMNGAGPRVSVGPDGKAWVIGTDYGVYAYNGNGWTHMGAWGLDIARGVRPEDAYVINMYNDVLKWTGSYNWAPITGIKANKIAVDPSGNPWVIDMSGKVFKYVGNGQWEDKRTTATDIFIHESGRVFIVGAGGVVYYLNPFGVLWSKSTFLVGTGIAVALPNPNMNYYLIDSSGGITRYIVIPY